MTEKNEKSDRYNKLLALTQAALLHDIGTLFQRANFSKEKTQEFERNLPFSISPEENSKLNPYIYLAKDCAIGIVDKTEKLNSEFLCSPWNSLFKDDERQKCNCVFDLVSLTPNDDMSFPKAKSELNKNPDKITEKYGVLSKQLMDRIAKNKNFSPSIQVDILLSALEHTTWCVPSSTVDLPNISLFDHSRTTAAIAVCLASFGMDSKDEKSTELDWEKVKTNTSKPFRFLVIDLAGIQDYIYDMNKSGFKGMAKVLRGRSFFVNAILEGIEIALLETLGLPRIVRLMDAGGKLIFLLPNRDDIEDRIRDFRVSLETGLMKETHGKLKVLFGLGVSFGVDCFLNNKCPETTIEKHYPLNDAYKSAFKALEKAKLRPYSIYLKQTADVQLEKEAEEEKNPYKNGACESCGKLPGKRKWQNEKEYYCDNCYSHREIGKDLLEGKFILFRKISKDDNKHNSCVLPGLVWKDKNNKEHVYVLEILKSYNSDKLKNASSIGFLWNDEKDSDLSLGHRIIYKASYARRCQKEEIPFLNDEVKEMSIEENDLLTFEHLSAKAKQQGAARYIAAVSGDVDNMGDLFEGLLERETAPLTMAVSVSRQFDFFFSGILDSHLRKTKKNIYTVYAGGDDLFYIGAWNDILDEVYEWRKLFGDYVANHPNVTFSVGVSLHHPNLPINRIRYDAEEQLKQAKNANKNDSKDKNRISVWDTPMKWMDKTNDEWSKFVIEYKNLLEVAMESESLKTAMSYRLLEYSRSAKRIAEKTSKSTIEDWMWGSRLRYDFARNWKKDKIFKDGLNDLGSLLESFYGSTGVDEKKIDIFGKKFPIALMWALYLVRNKNKDTQKGE